MPSDDGLFCESRAADHGRTGNRRLKQSRQNILFGRRGDVTRDPAGSLAAECRRLAPLLITEPELEARLSHLRSAMFPVHLVYWGSLGPASACLDVVATAHQLRQINTSFRMTVCGTGSLSQEIRHRIDELRLWSCVSVQQPMDFATELIPFLKREGDILLCCQRSGLQSTYAAALACGVPIIGFLQDDMKSLLADAHVGWLSPSSSPRLLSRFVMDILADRSVIEAKSRSAFLFSKELAERCCVDNSADLFRAR